MSLISMHGAWLSFSDAPLLDNAELHIEDNERVCLVGRNGAGKSTLMKILNREQGLDDGRIIYEQDLIVARLQQDPPRNVEGSVYDFVAEGIEEQAEYLKRYHDISRLVMNDPSEKNLNELAKVQEQLDHHNLWQLENRINEVLAQLGLDPNVALSSLSGGERNRLLLARLFLKPSNLLILDEPTNDLDVETLELLEELIDSYQGTVLLVSHDRQFVDNTVTECWIFEGGGKIGRYVGGYHDARGQQEQYVALKQPAVKKIEEAAAPKAETVKRSSSKLSYKLQRELEQLPQLLEDLEAKLEALQTQVADASFFSQPHEQTQKVLADMAAAEQELEQAFERWEYLEALKNGG